MSTEILYFSGTGNSLAIARDVADHVDGRLQSIPSVMDRSRIAVDADALGFVFPVYHKSIPLILKRFIERLEHLEKSPYLFAVCTYGDTPGLALNHLDALLQTRGERLAAGFGIPLPYNYLTPSPVIRGFFRSFTLREIPVDRQQALVADARARVDEISAFVSARESNPLKVTADPLTRLADALHLEERLAKPVWLKVAGVKERTDLSFIESRQLMDAGFHADESCTGCGICARVCPAHNIRLMDGEKPQGPVWQHRCEQCFACLHWCPEGAIQFGAETAGKPRYHHPDVTLAEMIRAARRSDAGSHAQGLPAVGRRVETKNKQNAKTETH